MVKASAGITDDDPAAEAFEKLRVCCESDAVADLLGVALGLLGAAEGDHRRGRGDRLGALRWAEQLADAQPLVLVFEDVQWADERLLDVIEHLARARREVPSLIVCIDAVRAARHRPSWGGGNPRASAIELGAARPPGERRLADELLPAGPPQSARCCSRRPRATRCSSRRRLGCCSTPTSTAALDRIPDSVQALIAARIDLLGRRKATAAARGGDRPRLLARSARAAGARARRRALGVLRDRDLVRRVERSAIPGDPAFQFTHVLIRDVAYGGMTKAERAENHERFAGWIEERAPDDLVEVRAHHLDRASALSPSSTARFQKTWPRARPKRSSTPGCCAPRRDAFANARRLFRRAFELAPTLERRFLAADAARGLNQIATVATEMERVRAEAHVAGNAAARGTRADGTR